jgi:anti-sigma28 factor (negative regulator of flagellin synthesis)
MRIDDLNRTPVPPGTEQSGQTGQLRTPKQDAVSGSNQPDQADVSPLAQSLAAPDPGRIEQLRLQVESGTYNVSAQTLANTLINAHLKE